MHLNPYIRKPWAISKNLARFYGVEKIETLLSFFNRSCCGNFYMVDYHEQKIIMGASTNPTFSGYSKRTVEKEKFKFYNRILKDGEREWLLNVHKEAFNVFFSYPEFQRQNLEFTYDLIVQTADNNEMVLRHKLIPFQLCNNGNFWLGLCFVTPVLSIPMLHKARIVNVETGEIYNYVNEIFVFQKFGTLTSEEIRILELLSKDVSPRDIYALLKISSSSFQQKKLKIFDKLNVQSWCAAIHQANKLEII